MSSKLIFALACIGILWFMISRESSQFEVSMQAIDPNETAEPVSQEIELINSEQIENHTAQDKRLDRIFQATRTAGLRSTGRVQDGKIQLEVNLEPQNHGCQRGDLDIIEDDLNLRNADSRLYLTLESLHDRRIYYQNAIQTEDLRSSQSLDIDLKEVRNSDLIGLFLCTKGSSQRDFCQDKNAGNIVELEDLLSKAKFENANYPAVDRIFFFQFMAIVEERLMIFDSSRRMSEDFTRLAAVLNRLNSNQNHNISGIIRRVERLIQNIGSVRPSIGTQHVTLYFPYQSPDCKWDYN